MDLTFNTRLDQIATFSDASATSSAKFDEFAKSPDDLSGIKKKNCEAAPFGVLQINLVLSTELRK